MSKQNKPRHRKRRPSHQPPRREGRLTPTKFLQRLGIRPSTPAQVFTPAYYRDVIRAGGDPLALSVHGEFSPQAGDYHFVTEEIARRFLSAGYDRYLGLLSAFDYLDGYPARPRRVADLGGGSGVVSMYLAARDPACRVAVYDHSLRQLELGRKWARELNLPNVEHAHASYRQLADGPGRGDCDLALLFYGLDTKAAGPGPSEDEQAAMLALARLLGDSGVGVISVALTPERAGYLFEAIRRADLGVDWRFTRFIWRECVGEGRVVWHGKNLVLDSFVFVRRGMPHLGVDAAEDLRAHLNSRGFQREPQCDGPKHPAPAPEHFRDGDVLLAALPGRAGCWEGLRLVQRDGWLLLEWRP